MDWQSLGVVMATVQQIIVDGANGVTQAPRVVPDVPGWQPWVWLAAVMAGAWCGRLMRAPTTSTPPAHPAFNRRDAWPSWMATMLLLASFVPGYRHVFVARADAPVRQAALADAVTGFAALYQARAASALGALPPGACYEPARDASCIPYGGLQDAVAHRLGTARRCMGGEARRVLLQIQACTPVSVEVRLAP